MTLTTHIVAGATIAGVLTKDPTTAFLVGWASHYALDAIPHWDYNIRSFEAKDKSKPLDKKVEFGKVFMWDVCKVLIDVCLGFGVLIVTTNVALTTAPISQIGIHAWLVLLAGAFGGVLPDFLQFVYGVWNVWPIRKLQEFHEWIHAQKKLDEMPAIGVPIQIGIVAIAGVVLLSVF